MGKSNWFKNVVFATTPAARWQLRLNSVYILASSFSEHINLNQTLKLWPFIFSSVERVISETLQDAISAANVEPATSVEQVMRDASSSVGVVDAVKSETRKFAKTRIDNDPDFKEVGDSFPNSKSFARKWRKQNIFGQIKSEFKPLN